MIIENKICKCGKIHKNPVDELIVGKGVINDLSIILKKYNAKSAFIIADKNTFLVAGETEPTPKS